MKTLVPGEGNFTLRPHQLSTKITSKISFKKAPVLKRKFWENIAENLHPVGREN